MSKYPSGFANGLNAPISWADGMIQVKTSASDIRAVKWDEKEGVVPTAYSAPW